MSVSPHIDCFRKILGVTKIVITFMMTFYQIISISAEIETAKILYVLCMSNKFEKEMFHSNIISMFLNLCLLYFFHFFLNFH